MRHFLFFTFASLLFISCKKENLDYQYDYRKNTEASEPSSIRLINLSTNDQLVVNGDSLTNFKAFPPSGPGVDPADLLSPGTFYFPKNGKLDRVWNFPQDLLRADNKAELKTTSRPWYSNITPIEVEFTVSEDYNDPKDYYLLIQNRDLVEWDKSIVEVPREVNAPSKPDHFKIRIINFSARTKSINSPLENLAGSMTLAFADGTSVSPETKDIQAGTWSEYVEIPYGTYQFKVLTHDGRQLASAAQNDSEFAGYLHPSTSTIGTGNGTIASNTTFAPVRSFQPGGVYTIVVHPFTFTWSDGQSDISSLQNGFEIIADISEPQNRTYARVQMANAFQDSELKLKTNEGLVTDEVSNGGATSYLNLVAGNRSLTIQDASGKDVVTVNTVLTAGANYTLWIYPDKNGAATALLMSNNLAGTWFVGDEDTGGDASIDRRRSDLPFDIRFLNLCADIPHLTITNGAGQPFGSSFSEGSGSNLQPGIPLLNNPYTRQSWGTTSTYQFLAYASAPGRLPGDWLEDIPYLSSDALVARKELYTNANRQIPAHEPGVYTIALTGRYSTGIKNAGFMVVKHTK